MSAPLSSCSARRSGGAAGTLVVPPPRPGSSAARREDDRARPDGTCSYRNRETDVQMTPCCVFAETESARRQKLMGPSRRREWGGWFFRETRNRFRRIAILNLINAMCRDFRTNVTERNFWFSPRKKWEKSYRNSKSRIWSPKGNF